METLTKDINYLRAVINAVPSAVFAVDVDFKIFDLNPAAKTLFGVDSDVVLHRLCGEVMHCMNAINSKGGCGTTAFCSDCVIRNSVDIAGNGVVTHKSKYELNIQKDGKLFKIHLLVSATPFTHDDCRYILLVLEDITEIVTLQGFLPICASCKKIRNDENYWEGVADYFRKHTDLEFTHSICPDCRQELYQDITQKKSNCKSK